MGILNDYELVGGSRKRAVMLKKSSSRVFFSRQKRKGWLPDLQRALFYE